MMKAHFIFCITLIIVTRLAPGQATTPPGMVYIEGGSFLMGRDGTGDSHPAHIVTLHSYYMDIHEVSNRQYEEFCLATGHRFPEFWGIEKYASGPDFPDHPVIGVSYADATKYAEWAGKRLPTEAEWEYAARGALINESYPNGSDIDSSLARINHPSFSPGPVSVMSFPPNGFGLYDMAGNVWEWVQDWYQEHYYSESPQENPGGPSQGRFRVIRGGGWHSGPGCNMVFYRNALPQHWVDIGGGFRCVLPDF